MRPRIPPPPWRWPEFQKSPCMPAHYATVYCRSIGATLCRTTSTTKFPPLKFRSNFPSLCPERVITASQWHQSLLVSETFTIHVWYIVVCSGCAVLCYVRFYCYITASFELEITTTTVLLAKMSPAAAARDCGRVAPGAHEFDHGRRGPRRRRRSFVCHRPRHSKLYYCCHSGNLM